MKGFIDGSYKLSYICGEGPYLEAAPAIYSGPFLSCQGPNKDLAVSMEQPACNFVYGPRACHCRRYISPPLRFEPSIFGLHSRRVKPTACRPCISARIAVASSPPSYFLVSELGFVSPGGSAIINPTSRPILQLSVVSVALAFYLIFAPQWWSAGVAFRPIVPRFSVSSNGGCPLQEEE